MYNLTNRAKEHFLNFFKSDDDKEEEFKDFLKAEYKKDWKAAYAWYLLHKENSIKDPRARLMKRSEISYLWFHHGSRGLPILLRNIGHILRSFQILLLNLT